MTSHLFYSGLSDTEQRTVLIGMLQDSAYHMDLLAGLRDSGLNDAWLVSGAIYNFVWNRLTGRLDLNGIKDADMFYFDDADLSYEAEDVEIKRLNVRFANSHLPIELRNQARVHLWYEGRFGRPYQALKSSRESVERFASKTHAVAARLGDDDEIEIFAPFGLEPIFGMRIVPNSDFVNPDTYMQKAQRALSHWPELIVENDV